MTCSSQTRSPPGRTEDTCVWFRSPTQLWGLSYGRPKTRGVRDYTSGAYFFLEGHEWWRRARLSAPAVLSLPPA